MKNCDGCSSQAKPILEQKKNKIVHTNMGVQQREREETKRQESNKSKSHLNLKYGKTNVHCRPKQTVYHTIPLLNLRNTGKENRK